jgi:hypothetical protein
MVRKRASQARASQGVPLWRHSQNSRTRPAARCHVQRISSPHPSHKLLAPKQRRGASWSEEEQGRQHEACRRDRWSILDGASLQKSTRCSFTCLTPRWSMKLDPASIAAYPRCSSGRRDLLLRFRAVLATVWNDPFWRNRLPKLTKSNRALDSVPRSRV